MRKHKKTGWIAVIAAMGAALPAAVTADDTSGAERTAKAFEADMARLTSEMNMAEKSATSTTTAEGHHGKVLGLDRLKTLMVKKNPDGTFTIGHVSNNADAVKKFIESDKPTGREEE